MSARFFLTDPAVVPIRVHAYVAPTEEYPERFEITEGTFGVAYTNAAEFDERIAALLAARDTLPGLWRQHHETQRILDAARAVAVGQKQEQTA
jgi:hypothetical protein